jgi:cobalt/nickel transport system permease protein
MHMADALLSPTVGGAMGAVTAAAVAWCSREVRREADDRRVPLMGVLGAFLFAAQMINFSIPGTGSSGHLGGGLLLAILLGPHAAFLVVASVLIVQALFFADGGLLALGCNIFNLGFLPAFVGYPLYRWIAGDEPAAARATTAAMAAAIVSLQHGAMAVVIETVVSGISALPLRTFALFMLPIHLVIGVVEGLVTSAIVVFVRNARPDLLASAPARSQSVAGPAVTFFALALALGGIGAWFASTNPDGLEWSVARSAPAATLLPQPAPAHATLNAVQQQAALLPNYGFRNHARTGPVAKGSDRLGTSVAGIVGGLLTLAFALLLGFALKARPGRR